MRLRNVKHAKKTLTENHQIVIPNPEDFSGRWNELFQNQNEIHIEIGCGKGKFITESAKQNPNINYIGIEKFDSVIIRALEKLIETPLKNVRLIRMDAEHLTKVFAKQEIDTIYLNFSDPWPKKRTAKRRLTSHRFLQRYHEVLQVSGKIKLKTDNFSLFQFSMMEINQDPRYSIDMINLNLYQALPKSNIQTEFEQRFVEKGNLIFAMNATYKGVLK